VEVHGFLPALDVMALPEKTGRNLLLPWLDDPAQRLATLFYTQASQMRMSAKER